jgi:hypothetical protein
MTLYVWFWIVTPTLLATFTLALLAKRKVRQCRDFRLSHQGST